jgi:hypothetical protein
VSDQPSATDKSKDHVEIVYRNMHQQVDQAGYPEADQDSTEATDREFAPMKSTEMSTEKSTNILPMSPMGGA